MAASLVSRMWCASGDRARPPGGHGFPLPLPFDYGMDRAGQPRAAASPSSPVTQPDRTVTRRKYA